MIESAETSIGRIDKITCDYCNAELAVISRPDMLKPKLLFIKQNGFYSLDPESGTYLEINRKEIPYHAWYKQANKELKHYCIKEHMNAGLFNYKLKEGK